MSKARRHVRSTFSSVLYETVKLRCATKIPSTSIVTNDEIAGESARRDGRIRVDVRGAIESDQIDRVSRAKLIRAPEISATGTVRCFRAARTFIAIAIAIAFFRASCRISRTSLRTSSVRHAYISTRPIQIDRRKNKKKIKKLFRLSRAPATNASGV